MLILALVLLPRSHAASRENFGLCVLEPFGKGVRPGILCGCLLSRGCAVCWAADALAVQQRHKKQVNSQVKELPLPLRRVDCGMMMLLMWLGFYLGDRRPSKVARP